MSESFELLKTLCRIHAPSGEEQSMKEFLIEFVETNKSGWAVQPEIVQGPDFQDSLLLVFGNPTTAIFAHMDSIGFTVRYGKQLVRIGSPQAQSGYKLSGKDSQGTISCELNVNDDNASELQYSYHREIDRGTSLVFACDFREMTDTIRCCYLDNRLGIYTALQVAKTLQNGIIVFSCWEEHGGGSVGYLGKHIFERYKVQQALISDITWVTEGVVAGGGVAISMRDSGIPRRSFVNKIIAIAKEKKVPHQLEVESAGGSDGNELQKSPYPFDWCFVGAPEINVHSPDEQVHKADIASMIALYKVLMQQL